MPPPPQSRYIIIMYFRKLILSSSLKVTLTQAQIYYNNFIVYVVCLRWGGLSHRVGCVYATLLFLCVVAVFFVWLTLCFCSSGCFMNEKCSFELLEASHSLLLHCYSRLCDNDAELKKRTHPI